MGTLHHLNVGCSDASIIETNTGSFLIDCHDIERYSHLLPCSKNLRGVFITHQHKDHYSGLNFLRSNGFTIDYLIYSPYQRMSGDNSVTIEEWDEFNSHKNYFEQRGTKLYPSYRQNAFKEPFWSPNGIKFWLIGPAKSVADSDTRELHDACLVILAGLGNRKCLFTGDASDKNLEYIAKNTNNYCDDILHASHHGSIEGAQIDFIKGCNISYTVISTQSGVYNNVPHPTALQRYNNHTKEKVYRTDKDGKVTWQF